MLIFSQMSYSNCILFLFPFSLSRLCCAISSRRGSHLCHCAVVNWYNWGLQLSCQNIIASCSFASWQESFSSYYSWKHQESLLESCHIWSRNYMKEWICSTLLQKMRLELFVRKWVLTRSGYAIITNMILNLVWLSQVVPSFNYTST